MNIKKKKEKEKPRTDAGCPKWGAKELRQNLFLKNCCLFGWSGILRDVLVEDTSFVAIDCDAGILQANDKLSAVGDDRAVVHYVHAVEQRRMIHVEEDLATELSILRQVRPCGIVKVRQVFLGKIDRELD